MPIQGPIAGMDATEGPQSCEPAYILPHPTLPVSATAELLSAPFVDHKSDCSVSTVLLKNHNAPPCSLKFTPAATEHSEELATEQGSSPPPPPGLEG